MNKKATVITATALSIPLLVGCSQADTEATATPAADSSNGSASPEAQTAHGSGAVTPSPATDSAAPSADPASTATGEASAAATSSANGDQLPAVADPCAGSCTETGRIPVEHPELGAMEVVTYHEVTSAPGAAPSTGKASYALYQNGQPVGYVGTDADGTEVSFGPSPALGGQTWELNNGSNVDKYGNVYLSYDKGVTVLTPTEAGYDSKGTMPPVRGIQAPFVNSDLTIDESGEPTITQNAIDANGEKTGETTQFTWDGSGFTAKN